VIQFSSEKDWSVLGSRDGGLMEEVSLGLTLKQRRDGEIGEHKLNEMGALNMK